MSDGRKPVAAVLVENPMGEHLVVQRAAGQGAAGFWTPVTGKLEAHESPQQAAEREALEETGLVIHVGEEVFRCHTVGAPFELIWLAARTQATQVEVNCLKELSDARLMRLADVIALQPMFPITRWVYEQLLAKRPLTNPPQGLVK